MVAGNLLKVGWQIARFYIHRQLPRNLTKVALNISNESLQVNQLHVFVFKSTKLVHNCLETPPIITQGRFRLNLIVKLLENVFRCLFKAVYVNMKNDNPHHDSLKR